jgi:tetratricopeptide (TPR) repeat protein
MQLTSQQYKLDNRLLAVEELLRQRKFDAAENELRELPESAFSQSPHERGLLLSLKAELGLNLGDYAEALKLGNEGAGILANFPLNRRYGRVLLVLSRTYSALGDLKLAETKAYDARASYRRAGDVLGQVDALNELGRVSFINSQYHVAEKFVAEAIDLAAGDERKVSQLTGNAGMIRVLIGQWSQAEADLNSAFEYHQSHGLDTSAARNLLAIGYLHISRREFVFAERALARALRIIEKNNLKR